MRKQGLLNGPISGLIASMGHGDKLVIADAGLPVPAGVPVIDVSISPGIPAFIDVLKAVLDDLVVENTMIAQEMQTVSPALYAQTKSLVGELSWEAIPHEKFKELTETAAAVIRTGECTPYANIILTAGVAF